MASIREEKARLRKHYLKICQKMPDSAALSENLEKSLLDILHEHSEIKTILGYVAHFPAEIDLLEFLLGLGGYDIYLPVTSNKSMRFYRVESISDLKVGNFGILEPKITAEGIYKDDLPALCLVPGLAFDKGMNRLGRGMGCYDKFLNGKDQVLKVGICHDFQIPEKIPVGRLDQEMDYLLTTNRIDS